MRAIILTFILLTFFNALPVHGKTKKRKLASINPSSIVLTVAYGEKTSVYRIEKKNKSFSLRFSNNDGSDKSVVLSQRDFIHFTKRAQELSEKPNDSALCERAVMDLKIFSDKPVRSVYGCISSGSEVAQDLRSLIEVLTAIL